MNFKFSRYKIIIKLHPYEDLCIKNLSEWVRKTNNIVLLKMIYLPRTGLIYMKY